MNEAVKNNILEKRNLSVDIYTSSMTKEIMYAIVKSGEGENYVLSGETARQYLTRFDEILHEYMIKECESGFVVMENDENGGV